MANKPLKSITFPGLADTYTIPQIDATVTQSGKAADAGAVGAKLSEISEANDRSFPVDTATGAVVTFPDGADDIPVKSVKVAIEPVQDLHGQDAPYPAGGGKNKFDGYTANWKKWQLNSNVFTTIPDTYTVITFTPNEDGTVTVVTTGTYLGIAVEIESSDADRVFSVSGASYVELVSAYEDGASRLNISPTYATIPAGVSGCIGIRFDAVGTYTIKCQLETGSTATDYAPYSNICPISGWTGANVVRMGKNLWDEEWEVGSISSGNPVQTSNAIRSKNFCPIKGGETYFLTSPKTDGGNQNMYYVFVVFYDENKNFINSTPSNNLTFTAPNNARYFKIATNMATVVYGGTYNHDISINYPSTDHDYHPYAGDTYSITFPSEAGIVYGGTLDVTSGVLMVDRAMVDLGTLDWTYDSSIPRFYSEDIGAYSASNSDVPKMECSQYKTIAYAYITNSAYDKCVTTPTNNGRVSVKDSSYSNAATFKTAMDGVQLVYELATPITYTLTPTEIKSLLGDNNIWADAGDTEVTYRADTKLYIDKKIAEVVNALS